MVGIFHAGDRVQRNGFAMQNNLNAGSAEGSSSGTVTRVYGDESNPLCDVSYPDGTLASGIPMSDLNAG